MINQSVVCDLRINLALPAKPLQSFFQDSSSGKASQTIVIAALFATFSAVACK
jgi:hypothetical protein